MTWGFVLLYHFLRLSKTIYQTTSPIFGKIKVVQKGRERKLLVNGVCQSINFDAPKIEHRVWGQMANLATQDLENLDLKGLGSLDSRPLRSRGVGDCLILGLGAGTIAHLLAQQFPGIGIDGVELDPAIIEVGKKFFDLDKIPNLNIICADAFGVVKNPKRYQLLIIDLYCGSRFPEKFEDDDFLLGVRNLLTPQGIAIFNRIFRRGRKDTLDGFIRKVGRVFGRIGETVVPGPHGFANLLIVAG